jgi:hypothetical protein
MISQLLSALLVLFSVFQQAPVSPQLPRQQQQGFRVSGVIVDAIGGQALAGAQVTLFSQAARDSGQTVTTGDGGRFSFENVWAGQYVLYARRRGYVEQQYKQHGYLSTVIIAGPDLNTDNLRFEMLPSASISGQILDEMGEPVRSGQVLLLQYGLRLGQRQKFQKRQQNTDDQGHYHFGHLVPGAYFVGVVAEPWYAQHDGRQRRLQVDSDSAQTSDSGAATNANDPLDVVYPIVFFPNATDIDVASPITLHPGDAEIADLRLQPVPAAHLTFRSSTTDGPEQVSVQHISQHIADGIEQTVPVRTTTWAPWAGSNIVEVNGLPPGRLNVTWTWSKGNQSTDHARTLQLGNDLEINPSDTASSASVSGVATMDDGSALAPQARLGLRNASAGTAISVLLKPGGEFNFDGQNIDQGTYEVGMPQPSGALVRSISATGAKVSGHTIEIGSARDVRLTVVVSKDGGTVTGLALKKGKPADGVMILLVPQGPEPDASLFRFDQSDSDGSFSLARVLPGKYTVVAIENGWDLEWSDPGVSGKYLAGGQAIQVSSDTKIKVTVNVQQ